MMLTNEEIKQIFLQCENKDPNGLYANDVDILEFGRKLEQKAREDGSKEELFECIKFVRSLNTHVADALKEKRKWSKP